MITRNESVSPTKIWAESEGSGKGTMFWFALTGVPAEWDTEEL
jgi:hypothetical protein